MFGSVPFETNSNWKLDELTDVDDEKTDYNNYNEHSSGNGMPATCNIQNIRSKSLPKNVTQFATIVLDCDDRFTSHDSKARHSKRRQKSDATQRTESSDNSFKGTLQKVVDKLKDERAKLVKNNGNEVVSTFYKIVELNFKTKCFLQKKIFEKKRSSGPIRLSSNRNVACNSHLS